MYRNDGLLDGEAGAFFHDELRTIDQRVLEDERPPQNGFAYIPQMNSVGMWDNEYEERSMQFVGVAEFLGDHADDMPMVDVALRADLYNVRGFWCGYSFDIGEIEKAMSLGRPLDAWKARAAMAANEEKHNRIMWYGDPATQLFGVLNNPFANRYILPSTIVGTAAATVLTMLNNMVTIPFDETETTAMINFLGLAPLDYRYIATTPLQTGQDTTILQHFIASNEGFQNGRGRVVPIRELKAAGPTGENLMVAWETNPDVVKHNVAMLFRRFSPVQRLLSQVIPTMGRSGGVSMRQPRKVVIGEVPAS